MNESQTGHQTMLKFYLQQFICNKIGTEPFIKTLLLFLVKNFPNQF